MESDSKVCKKCFETKSISLFYTHKDMADGHLNICIKCVKNRVYRRYDKLSKDPNWVDAQRERYRDRPHIINRNFNKPSQEYKTKTMKRYFEKYPEKYFAMNISKKVPCPSGLQKHHWSYSPENAMDVIILKREAHSYFHRHHTYDPERMAYRNRRGVLVDKKDTFRFLLEHGLNIHNSMQYEKTL